MAIGKFPGKLLPIFKDCLYEDYRTHTVPVKKYEPRMFMGKEVPEEATHYIIEGDNVVFFMMHPGLGMCVHFEHEGGSSWINYRNTKYPAHTFYELIKLPEQENIMKKEFSKSDLRSGMKVVLRNGDCYTVFLNAVMDEDIIVNGVCGIWTRLSNYSHQLKTWQADEDIMEVYSPYGSDMMSHGVIGYKPIWEREEKTKEQLAYEALQAQIAEEEARHADSMKALRKEAEKLKPKAGG